MINYDQHYDSDHCYSYDYYKVENDSVSNHISVKDNYLGNVKFIMDKALKYCYIFILLKNISE